MPGELSSEGPTARRRREGWRTGAARRPTFVLVCCTVLGALALLAAGYAACVAKPESALGEARDRPDSTLAGVLAVVLAQLVLFALVYALSKARARIGWWLLALPLWWLAVELLAAPHLSRALHLGAFFFVRDPDHWPTAKRSDLNSDGLRCTPESASFAEPGFNVLFLGDSFAWGYLVPCDQAFPELLEARLRLAFPGANVRVANFGWVSASPFLALRRLEQIGTRYRPDLVVLCFDMTDFYDDILYANMIERRGLYRWYDKFPIALKLMRMYATPLFDHFYWRTNDNLPRKKFFAVDQPLETSRPFLEASVSHLRSISDWCRERDARFLLIVLPRYFQYSARECPRDGEAHQYTVLGPHSLEPFRFFDELRERVDFPIHPLLRAFQETEVFPTCFETDAHWNASGHAVAADAMSPLLEQEVRALRER